MLVEITYACKMNCSHCMSDCRPDGENMSLSTLEDALKFMCKNKILTWNFSGGEMFEHPQILDVLGLIEDYYDRLDERIPITFITNGRELVRNSIIYDAVRSIQSRLGKKNIIIQVTDDERFYPDPLSDREKYWLKKLGAIIDTVPSNPNDKTQCLYPQGRALINHPDSNWNTIGPKCANCRLIALQMPTCSFKRLTDNLFAHQKVCTPVIAPNGDIKIGESALCPAVANIYQTDKEIMNGIRNCRCHQCTIPWNRLKETNKLAYNMLIDNE